MGGRTDMECPRLKAEGRKEGAAEKALMDGRTDRIFLFIVFLHPLRQMLG
jgi:hypothetical protein